MIYELALKEWGRDRKQIRREWSYEYLNLMIERMADRKQREAGEAPEKRQESVKAEGRSEVGIEKVAVING